MSIKKKILELIGIVGILLLVGTTFAMAERTGTPPIDKSGRGALSGLVTQDLGTGGLTKEDLVNSLLGGGVTISNVTYTGANNAAGTFSGGTGIIGFENGIILSTGNISSVPGPNEANDTTTDNGLSGDAALDTLIPGGTTYDASVLEFDFIPTTSQMTFRYVFGSEEYNEYANTEFNDVFGFFVNGNDVSYNIALLPGVTPPTPVAINNVNGGNPLGTNPQHPEFYLNNALYPFPPTINTELDGLTVVLTATAAVNPGVTNHIKMAIGDVADHAFDSDVFIEAGSVLSLELSLAPVNATNIVGTTHTLTATLIDTAGVPIPGKTINFTVSGVNPQIGTGTTNSTGIATFTYTGLNAGTDTIVATGEGKTSNTAYKKWIPEEPIIPEFPTVALPVASILGLMFLISRMKKN